MMEDHSQEMAKFNMKKDAPKLNEVQLHYMRLLEQKNRERAHRMARIRKNSRLTGSLAGAAVLGIYFYTIFAVKQEKFLDDLE